MEVGYPNIVWKRSLLGFVRMGFRLPCSLKLDGVLKIAGNLRTGATFIQELNKIVEQVCLFSFVGIFATLMPSVGIRSFQADVQIRTRHRPIDFICVYQHTMNSSHDRLRHRQDLWNQLDAYLAQLSRRNVLMVMGDFNCGVRLRD